jgi:hypothetical protein
MSDLQELARQHAPTVIVELARLALLEGFWFFRI